MQSVAAARWITDRFQLCDAGLLRSGRCSSVASVRASLHAWRVLCRIPKRNFPVTARPGARPNNRNPTRSTCSPVSRSQPALQ